MVLIALLAGMAYASVAIPSQTQLQEDLPEDVRGRVFGILNMLVSVASFLPILIVGPLSDFIGTTTVLIAVGFIVTLCGRPVDPASRADPGRASATATARCLPGRSIPSPSR